MTTLSEHALRPVSWWRERLDTDILVIGAGIAGLSMTLRLPPGLQVVVVTKGSLGESNTWYAQGGLAAAVGLDDDPDLHLADTVAAGAGLCDEAAVRALVEGGPEAVSWLLSAGTRFDRTGDEFQLGKEAAHSRNRVLHAGGDATGAEIERSLVAKLRARQSVSIIEHATALDLVRNVDGSCGGATIQVAGETGPRLIAASATVLANGGAGQLWAVTSNPPGATGDGAAMALRAGVPVADLEFTQFHPTVLALPGQVPFLITEAIRGEGAYLLSQHGDRFMVDLDPAAELAPRDVVARAIQDQITGHGGKPVFLDLSHLDPDMVHRRFPTIAARLATMGLDLTCDPIPVAPAAHYFMGGIVAGADGRTGMDGLHAIGEVACTGVHGANRLASNSLLEGLVFGLQLGEILSEGNLQQPDRAFANDRAPAPAGQPSSQARRSIQQLMSQNVAVVRSEAGLVATLESLDDIATAPVATDDHEARNLYLLAREVTRSAIARRESRGAHFRSDHPDRDAWLDHQHQLVIAGADGWTRSFDALSAVVDGLPARADS